ncbi:hypothetical protein IFM89_008888 [Coptis chinensis]|uniref:Uncharacterized protein n=1 Tax=Coptis chinensis TaxID=261450 RepID=A0A835HUG3_9MAGN|nr:hypothetical protein IFM89_008888 [Coptis chinensis]
MYRSVATTTTRGGMLIFDHDVNSKIYLWRGNPWNLQVDAVVNSTNENFDKAQSRPTDCIFAILWALLKSVATLMVPQALLIVNDHGTSLNLTNMLSILMFELDKEHPDRNKLHKEQIGVSLSKAR